MTLPPTDFATATALSLPDEPPRSRPRLAWIDCLRGLGMVTVVVGHLWAPSSTFLYWFHMPLFFVLSGYLHRRQPSMDFVRRLSGRLIMPYMGFVALLFATEVLEFATNTFTAGGPFELASLGNTLAKCVLGGRFLVGRYGTAWFVTCLFATQVAYACLEARLSPVKLHTFVACLYGAALLWPQPPSGGGLPLALEIVPMALVFFHLGHVATRHARPNTWACVGVAFAAVAVEATHPDLLTFVMKYGRYGLPFVSIIIALAFTALMARLALAIGALPPIDKGLQALGKASLSVMFLHLYINELLLALSLSSTVLRVSAALALPLLANYFFGRYGWSRRLFLGSTPQPGWRVGSVAIADTESRHATHTPSSR